MGRQCFITRIYILQISLIFEEEKRSEHVDAETSVNNRWSNKRNSDYPDDNDKNLNSEGSELNSPSSSRFYERNGSFYTNDKTSATKSHQMELDGKLVSHT